MALLRYYESTRAAINELTRAALRDVGKFICNRFRSNYYSLFSRRKGKIGKYTQYWVRKKECDLQVGLKPSAFYGGLNEAPYISNNIINSEQNR